MTPEASDTPKRARKARPTAAERQAAAGSAQAEERNLPPASTETDGLHVRVEGEPEAIAKALATGSQKTLYEVSRQVQDVDVDDADRTLWWPVARLEAADAKAAAKTYAESLEEFAGGELRVVPVRNITSVTVGVETRRQLTIT